MSETTIEPPLSQQLATIDAPMERKRVGDMVINKWAGLTFAEYREAIEFAKLMSQARNSIPGYLKQNAGDCLAIITQALRWHLEPYWCAQHSYIAKAEALIAYDSAVHNAIILSSELLKHRPRYHFSGEGEDRVCTVSATFTGETEALTYTTPPLKQCRPPRNDSGTVKGSPLWDKDPDQQLGYYAIRNWGRRHAPEILAGVYSIDEVGEVTQDDTDITPPSPNLMARLPGRMEGAGFQGGEAHVVDPEIAAEAKAEKAAEKKAKEARGEPAEPNGQVPAQPAVVQPAQEQATGEAPKAKAPNPKTPGEYQLYASNWFERMTDPDDIEARWDGEMEMRRQLKVPVPMRKQMEGALRARVNKLRGVK